MKQAETGESTMKKFLLGTAGLIALGMAAPAAAADLPARPYTKAPAYMAAIYDWSGFYVGANAGWGTTRKCWDFTSAAGTFIGAEGCHNATGGVAGGQVGYRWQSGALVYGLEAQGDWAGLSGSNTSLLFGTTTNRSRVDAFGLFTGQVGYALNNALLYAKGGAAVTTNRYDVLLAGTVVASAKENGIWGGTAGAGIEYGFAPAWSAAVEYDHIFTASRLYTFTTPAGGFAGMDRIRGDVDLVTARINYRFGPDIGKY
jgi:outer membrane immunogenic protein